MNRRLRATPAAILAAILTAAVIGPVAGPVAAQGQTPPLIPPPPAIHLYRKPAPSESRLTGIPDADELARYYPDKAQRANVEGFTVMRCGVTAQGLLIHCFLMSQTPAGYGFGRAALLSAELFSASPRMVRGRPVGGGWIVVRMKWKLPRDDDAPTQAPPAADPARQPQDPH